MMSNRSRRAAALIFVLGVLFVLASLAITFARSMSVERDAAKSRSDEVQAKFAAWAGWEHAWTQVRLESKEPVGAPPDLNWFYRGLTGRNTGNGISLDQATAPSYKLGTGPSGLAYSGVVGSTYEANGDTYALKILDAASMININMPLDSRLSDADQPLLRMLNNLSRAIALSEPYKTWFPGDTYGPLYDENLESISEYIMAYRKTLANQEYSCKQQILEIPGLVINTKKFLYVQDFLTVHSYADPTMVAPMDPAYLPANMSLVYGRVPTGTPVLQERSPINVNTAPPEVLAAVFTDLRGYWIDRALDRSTVGSNEYNAVGRVMYTNAITLNEGMNLAAEIVTRREGAAGAFTSWEDFRSWLQGTAFLTDQQEAVLLANCDPNVNTHRSNPDLVLWRDVDKFDVFDSTTELCFNSCGVFEIESLGRVTYEGGVIRAQAQIKAVIELFNIYRETTQNQFNNGDVTTREVRTPLIRRLTHAILTEGDLTINGTVDITGAGGGVHTNSDLSIIGQPSFQTDATATGSYSSTSGKETVGGAQGGGYDAIPIPTLSPADYKADADVIYGADGKARDQSGAVLGDGEYGPFKFKSGEWEFNGSNTNGTYYFETSVKIAGGTSGTWQVTIISTGHVSITGNPLLTPDHSSGLTVLAGTDFKMHGTPAGGTTGTLGGIYYAREQVSVSGTTDIEGTVIAKDTGNSDTFIDSNGVGGTVGIDYDGGFSIVYGYETHQVETLTRYPDPNAIGKVGGADVNLASFNNYDGYIALAPMTTSKTYLGSEPPTDALLANWEGAKGLDADFGGGTLTMGNDVAGPTVTPIAGETTVGNLLRDGYYSEYGAVGSFLAPDNIGAKKGTIQFWFKPSWNGTTDSSVVTRSTKTHELVDLSRAGTGGKDQDFSLFRTGQHSTWGNWSDFYFERSAVEARSERREIYSSWFPPAHEWSHIVVVYDVEETNYLKAIAFYVNGALIPSAIYDGLDSFALDAAEAADSSITPGNSIRLGERSTATFLSSKGIAPVAADGTFDGFMTLGTVKDANWAQILYSEGRYYSGGDAVYNSQVLPIPVGSDILHATWTLRYPSGWNGDPVQIELINTAGGTSTVVGSAANGQGIIGAINDISGAINYKLIFQGGTALNAPYYTTPIVDDVTIAFAQDPVILLWEE